MRRPIRLFVTMTIVALVSAAVSAKGPVVYAKKLKGQVNQTRQLPDLSRRTEKPMTQGAAAHSSITTVHPTNSTVPVIPTHTGTAVMNWSNGVEFKRRPVPLIQESKIVTIGSSAEEVKPTAPSTGAASIHRTGTIVGSSNEGSKMRRAPLTRVRISVWRIRNLCLKCPTARRPLSRVAPCPRPDSTRAAFAKLPISDWQTRNLCRKHPTARRQSSQVRYPQSDSARAPLTRVRISVWRIRNLCLKRPTVDALSLQPARDSHARQAPNRRLCAFVSL